MLPPPQPPATERSAHHAETDSLRSPNPATRLSAIDLYPITESLKAHNEDSGLGATLGRLIVGMANHIVELPPNARVAPRELMTEAIREESSQRASSRDLVEAEIAPTLAAIGLKVGPVNSGWQFAGVGRDFDSKHLSLHIEDAELFSRYLDALDPTTIKQPSFCKSSKYRH